MDHSNLERFNFGDIDLTLFCPERVCKYPTALVTIYVK